MSIFDMFMSPQNENVRFVQSRNVRFHEGPEVPWKRSEWPCVNENGTGCKCCMKYSKGA